jgi:hypothetical protein
MVKRAIILSFLAIFFVAISAQSQTLVHYWNFNDATNQTTLLTPYTLLSGTSITHIQGGISAIDVAGGTGQNFSVQNLNARFGDASGNHLRFNDPIGGALVFALPTTGYKDIVVKYATRRSGSGAGYQIVSYTTDGTNYTILDTIQPNNGDPTLITLDFTSKTAVNNNPNFKIKYTFEMGFGGTVGNNRFDNYTTEGNAVGGDNAPPVITFVPSNNSTNVALNIQPTLTFNESIRLLDNSAITNSNVASLLMLKLNDVNGMDILFNATINDKVITVVPQNLINDQKYYLALKPNMVEDLSDNAVISTLSTQFTTVGYSNKISFLNNFIVVDENSGSYTLSLKLENPTNSSVNLVVKPAPWSTATPNQDFIFNSTTLQFNPNSSTTQVISIPITDDMLSEDDEYFVLSLENLNGVSISGFSYATIYIRDNDKKVVAASNELSLNYVGSFKANSIQGSTSEIVDYDPSTKRLYITSAIQDRLDIADFSNPANVQLIKSINMLPYGGITSVAVRNGIVAVASPNADETLPGSVVFFDGDGNFLKQVTVGSLPDMITFTPDGNKVITANEGQPNLSYSVDPEGSVSIIDISGGIQGLNQSKVTTLLFTQYNSQEAQLIASGVRKLKKTSTLSQDFEPEYITISEDSKKAWVTLQENNAIAEINLMTNSYSGVWTLGTKDAKMDGNGFDASDNNGQILLSNWNIKQFFIPDGLANFSYNGTRYLISANEGDEKEYTPLNERTTVGASNYNLDPSVYPNASVLKQTYNLGRMRVTNQNGDENNDGLFEQIYSLGTRSFSIWNADTKTIVWDSKNDFEQFISKDPVYKSIFNADNEGSVVVKARSRAKGPEPEGVATAKINDNLYAFVGLERVGGVMAYNITNPMNPHFVTYSNSRIVNQGGDLGPEGIIYVNWDKSPDTKNYVIVANELSGTLSIYQVITAPRINTFDKEVCLYTPVQLGTILNNKNVTVINGSGDYQYNWYPTIGLQNPTSNNPTLVNPIASQQVTLIVKDNVTNQSATGSFNVTVFDSPVNMVPTVTNHPKNTPLDLNTLTVGNISGGLAPYQFVWANQNGTVINPDVIPAIGANRYFLTVIDSRGCSTIAKRIIVYVSPRKDAVNEDITIGNNGDILLESYPNPVVDKLNTNIELSQLTNIKITITDMTGLELKRMETYSNKLNTEILLNDLRAGVYFLNVETPTDHAVKKLIKN